MFDAEAENVIAQLQAIGVEIGSKEANNYVDTSVIEDLNIEIKSVNSPQQFVV